MIIQKNEHSHKSRGPYFRPSSSESHYIQFLLKQRGLSVANLGKSLRISRQFAHLVIYGRRRSRRVEAEIARILGHTEWNDVVMEAQLATQGHGKPAKAQIQKAKAQVIKKRQQLIIRKRKATRKALGLSSQKEAV